MRIKLVNKSNETYKGVNRSFMFNRESSRNGIIEYLDILFPDSQDSLPFTIQSLSQIESYIKNQNSSNNIEVIIFGEIGEEPELGEFLGYDVSGNSLCFSPLSDITHLKSTSNPVSLLLYNYFIPKINENGLFWNLDDAIELSKVSSYLNKLVEGGFFEPDENIRPLTVYVIKF